MNIHSSRSLFVLSACWMPQSLMIHVHQLELKFGVVPDSKLSVCKSCVSRFTENEPLSTCVILTGNCLLLRSQWLHLFLCSSLSRGAMYLWTVYEAFTNIKIINQAKFDSLDLWVSKCSFFHCSHQPSIYLLSSNFCRCREKCLLIWLFLGLNGCTEWRSAEV